MELCIFAKKDEEETSEEALRFASLNVLVALLSGFARGLQIVEHEGDASIVAVRMQLSPGIGSASTPWQNQAFSFLAAIAWPPSLALWPQVLLAYVESAGAMLMLVSSGEEDEDEDEEGDAAVGPTLLAALCSQLSDVQWQILSMLLLFNGNNFSRFEGANRDVFRLPGNLLLPIWPSSTMRNAPLTSQECAEEWAGLLKSPFLQRTDHAATVGTPFIVPAPLLFSADAGSASTGARPIAFFRIGLVMSLRWLDTRREFEEAKKQPKPNPYLLKWAPLRSSVLTPSAAVEALFLRARHLVFKTHPREATIAFIENGQMGGTPASRFAYSTQSFILGITGLASIPLMRSPYVKLAATATAANHQLRTSVALAAAASAARSDSSSSNSDDDGVGDGHSTALSLLSPSSLLLFGLAVEDVHRRLPLFPLSPSPIHRPWVRFPTVAAFRSWMAAKAVARAVEKNCEVAVAKYSASLQAKVTDRKAWAAYQEPEADTEASRTQEFLTLAMERDADLVLKSVSCIVKLREPLHTAAAQNAEREYHLQRGVSPNENRVRPTALEWASALRPSLPLPPSASSLSLSLGVGASLSAAGSSSQTEEAKALASLCSNLIVAGNALGDATSPSEETMTALLAALGQQLASASSSSAPNGSRNDNQQHSNLSAVLKWLKKRGEDFVLRRPSAPASSSSSSSAAASAGPPLPGRHFPFSLSFPRRLNGAVPLEAALHLIKATNHDQIPSFAPRLLAQLLLEHLQTETGSSVSTVTCPPFELWKDEFMQVAVSPSHVYLGALENAAHALLYIAEGAMAAHCRISPKNAELDKVAGRRKLRAQLDEICPQKLADALRQTAAGTANCFRWVSEEEERDFLPYSYSSSNYNNNTTTSSSGVISAGGASSASSAALRNPFYLLLFAARILFFIKEQTARHARVETKGGGTLLVPQTGTSFRGRDGNIYGFLVRVLLRMSAASKLRIPALTLALGFIREALTGKKMAGDVERLRLTYNNKVQSSLPGRFGFVAGATYTGPSHERAGRAADWIRWDTEILIQIAERQIQKELSLNDSASGGADASMLGVIEEKGGGAGGVNKKPKAVKDTNLEDTDEEKEKEKEKVLRNPGEQPKDEGTIRELLVWGIPWPMPPALVGDIPILQAALPFKEVNDAVLASYAKTVGAMSIVGSGGATTSAGISGNVALLKGNDRTDEGEDVFRSAAAQRDSDDEDDDDEDDECEDEEESKDKEQSDRPGQPQRKKRTTVASSSEGVHEDDEEDGAIILISDDDENKDKDAASAEGANRPVSPLAPAAELQLPSEFVVNKHSFRGGKYRVTYISPQGLPVNVENLLLETFTAGAGVASCPASINIVPFLEAQLAEKREDSDTDANADSVDVDDAIKEIRRLEREDANVFGQHADIATALLRHGNDCPVYIGFETLEQTYMGAENVARAKEALGVTKRRGGCSSPERTDGKDLRPVGNSCGAALERASIAAAEVARAKLKRDAAKSFARMAAATTTKGAISPPPVTEPDDVDTLRKEREFFGHQMKLKLLLEKMSGATKRSHQQQKEADSAATKPSRLLPAPAAFASESLGVGDFNVSDGFGNGGITTNSASTNASANAGSTGLGTQVGRLARENCPGMLSVPFLSTPLKELAENLPQAQASTLLRAALDHQAAWLRNIALHTTRPCLVTASFAPLASALCIPQDVIHALSLVAAAAKAFTQTAPNAPSLSPARTGETIGAALQGVVNASSNLPWVQLAATSNTDDAAAPPSFHPVVERFAEMILSGLQSASKRALLAQGSGKATKTALAKTVGSGNNSSTNSLLAERLALLPPLDQLAQILPVYGCLLNAYRSAEGTKTEDDDGSRYVRFMRSLLCRWIALGTADAWQWERLGLKLLLPSKSENGKDGGVLWNFKGKDNKTVQERVSTRLFEVGPSSLSKSAAERFALQAVGWAFFSNVVANNALTSQAALQPPAVALSIMAAQRKRVYGLPTGPLIGASEPFRQQQQADGNLFHFTGAAVVEGLTSVVSPPLLLQVTASPGGLAVVATRLRRAVATSPSLGQPHPAKRRKTEGCNHDDDDDDEQAAASSSAPKKNKRVVVVGEVLSSPATASWRGCFGENAVWSCLYHLLFWGVIFADSRTVESVYNGALIAQRAKMASEAAGKGQGAAGSSLPPLELLGHGIAADPINDPSFPRAYRYLALLSLEQLRGLREYLKWQWKSDRFEQRLPNDYDTPDSVAHPARRCAFITRSMQLLKMTSCELAEEVGKAYEEYAGTAVPRLSSSAWSAFDRETLIELAHAAGPVTIWHLMQPIISEGGVAKGAIYGGCGAADHPNDTKTGWPDVGFFRPVPCPHCPYAFRPLLVPAAAPALPPSLSSSSTNPPAPLPFCGRLVVDVRSSADEDDGRATTTSRDIRDLVLTVMPSFSSSSAPSSSDHQPHETVQYCRLLGATFAEATTMLGVKAKAAAAAISRSRPSTQQRMKMEVDGSDESHGGGSSSSSSDSSAGEEEDDGTGSNGADDDCFDPHNTSILSQSEQRKAELKSLLDDEREGRTSTSSSEEPSSSSSPSSPSFGIDRVPLRISFTTRALELLQYQERLKRTDFATDPTIMTPVEAGRRLQQQQQQQGNKKGGASASSSRSSSSSSSSYLAAAPAPAPAAPLAPGEVRTFKIFEELSPETAVATFFNHLKKARESTDSTKPSSSSSSSPSSSQQHAHYYLDPSHPRSYQVWAALPPLSAAELPAGEPRPKNLAFAMVEVKGKSDHLSKHQAVKLIRFHRANVLSGLVWVPPLTAFDSAVSNLSSWDPRLEGSDRLDRYSLSNREGGGGGTLVRDQSYNNSSMACRQRVRIGHKIVVAVMKEQVKSLGLADVKARERLMAALSAAGASPAAAGTAAAGGSGSSSSS